VEDDSLGLVLAPDRGLPAAWSAASSEGEYEQPSHYPFVGAWDAGELVQLPVVRQSVSIDGKDNSPISYASLSGPLATEGIDRLEVVHGFYYTNLRMNKEDYAT
jgi:hypothetical protein